MHDTTANTPARAALDRIMAYDPDITTDESLARDCRCVLGDIGLARQHPMCRDLLHLIGMETTA
jgi:hypothetical protein